MIPQTIKKGVDVSFYQRDIDFNVMASRGIERIYMPRRLRPAAGCALPGILAEQQRADP